MKFMTKLETIIMNRTGCNQETANLVANDILAEVDKAEWTTNDYNLDKQIALLFKDISDAPTGGVDSDFNIRHLNEQLSDVFIRTLAGHLIANGWRKET